MSERPSVQELRELILRAAPDPAEAAPVQTCAPDARLDELIPFSSVIVLGTVVAIEDRFGVEVTNRALRQAAGEGITLERLASMIQELTSARDELG